MKRTILLKAFSASLLALAAAPDAQAQQVMIQQVRPAIQPQPATPATPAKPREEVVVDPKTDPNPKSLEINPELQKKAKELVQQLGSASYREREIATRELQKLGRSGILALHEAKRTDTNPEVRLRTEICLPYAEADDMRAKVNCFLADVEAKYDHSLPGWDKFKQVVGNDKPARELFAEVLKKRDMHALLMASELPAGELGTVLSNHYRDMQNRMNGMVFNGRGYIQPNQPSTSELIVMIFLESVYTDRELGLNYMFNTSVVNYMHQPEIQNAMTGRGTTKFGEQIKKVCIRWMETRETGQGAQYAMNFAQNWNMQKEINKYAARVLMTETQNNNFWVKTNAITLLGQRNGKEYLDALVKVFDDATVIQQPWPGAPANQSHPITLGDFALGVAISITNQNHKDYNLEVLNTSWKWNQNNYYFKDEEKNKADDKRKAALKKWNEWAKKEKEAKKDTKDPKDPKEPKKEEPKSDVKDVPKAPGLPVKPKPLPGVAPGGNGAEKN